MSNESYQGQSNPSQVRSKIRQTWSNLNDDEIAYYEEGDRNEFLSAVQKKYGLMRDQADKILNNLERQTREAA